MTILAVVTGLLIGQPAAAGSSREDLAFFEAKVRPILVARCYECHSMASRKQRGGLRVDSRASLLKGGDTGPAVSLAQPEASLFWRALHYAEDAPHMPPKGKLPGRELTAIEEWMRRGAPMPDGTTVTAPSPDLRKARKFWSFQPPQEAPAPPIHDVGRPRRKIDPFILAELEKRNVTPSSEADRRVLARRVFYDLVGLPPSAREVDQFAADERPDAYERLVERLLASPQHGERWGRFWLDLTRYADVTEQWTDCKAPSWPYRDWVVRALNEDMPYDRFVACQLAADRLPDSRPADRAALGFLALSPTYWKELKLAPDVIKTVVAEEWEEKVQAVTGTFLGLTVACARCHDHKFDPITMQDYYALAGVFASIKPVDRPVPNGAAPVQAPMVEDAALFVLPDGPHKTKLEYRPGTAQDVAMQVRGNPASAGAVVPRRFLAVLSPDRPRAFHEGSGRLELAQSIVREGAPLAARVLVNRVWKHHFGAGLVETPSDFGSQGARPTHPALLDDLAARFIASGWSLKWLHREIVLSGTYRQASAHDPARHAADPDNRWLWRMNRRRLEVEAWRDTLLTRGESLDLRVGGPAADLGDARNRRRTVYGIVKRRELHDILRLYDFPDPVSHSPARVPTTTPLQQLYALNSPFLRHQAQSLARRIQANASADETSRVRRAYRVLFQRQPRDTELSLGLSFLAGGKRDDAWASYAQALLETNELLFVD